MTFPRRKKILVLLGPSGVGKTSLIHEIVRLDMRFRLVKAYTTRPLRPAEKFRIAVSEDEFDALVARERLLLVNKLYGYRYGTPKRAIDEVLAAGYVPVLDCPISQLWQLEREYPGLLYRVYIQPPSPQILRRRLSDGRDPDHSRFQAALEELAAAQHGEFDTVIDLRLVNEEGELRAAALQILASFRPAEEDWPDLHKVKLKNDRFRNTRGGTAVLLEILCAACGNRVVLYQKDGRGRLHRLYLNRLCAPQAKPGRSCPIDIPPLTCAACGSLIGLPMRHADGRLAFRLRPGSFSKRRVRP